MDLDIPHIERLLRCECGTPVIPFAGWSGCGKTTLIVKVVRELSERGLCVGYVKHHGHGGSLDVKGKDSWRCAQAGAGPIVVSSSSECLAIRRTGCDMPLMELAQGIASECDLVIAEGFKNQVTFGVEVLRHAHNPERILDDERTLALATDSAELAKKVRKAGIAVFSLDDAQGLAAFVAQVASASREGAGSA